MNARTPLPLDREAILESAEASERHQPSCPGCERCMRADTKPDREYPNARDLDLVGRELRAGK